MLFIGPLGGWELIIILLVVLIIFGPSKLPQMGQSLGKAIREFKKAGKELKSEVTDLDDEDVKETKPKPSNTASDTIENNKSKEKS
jgi:sec-independent protein translocase protein TatA